MPKLEKKSNKNKDLLMHKKRSRHSSVRNRNSLSISKIKPKESAIIVNIVKRVISDIVKNRIHSSVVKITIYKKEYNHESVSIKGAIKTLKSGKHEDLDNYEALIKKYYD